MQVSSEPIKQSKLLQIPDPVFYDRIKFNDPNDNQKLVSYTDCWEISVLRFLHLVFGKNGKILQERLTKYMDIDDKHCQRLINFFKRFPTYEMKEEYYTTEQGFNIRSQWAQFLNNCGLLDLKLYGRYEVKATVMNLLRFFKGFFPKLKFVLEYVTKFSYTSVMSGEISKEYEHILSQIYKELSFDHKIICCSECTFDDNNLNMLEFWFTQNIFVDQVHRLNWTINEFYNLDGPSLADRLGGHSDYRYC